MSDWEPPKNVPPVIVCAANRLSDGLIIAGARHWDDIMAAVARRIIGDDKAEYGKAEQGFIDQWGRFYTREEAYLLVQSNGQPFNAERNQLTSILFSEGLY